MLIFEGVSVLFPSCSFDVCNHNIRVIFAVTFELCNYILDSATRKKTSQYELKWYPDASSRHPSILHAHISCLSFSFMYCSSPALFPLGIFCCPSAKRSFIVVVFVCFQSETSTETLSASQIGTFVREIFPFSPNKSLKKTLPSHHLCGCQRRKPPPGGAKRGKP